MGFIKEVKYVGDALCQSKPPKPTFSVDQMPDLNGQVCIVTGGYTGIGKETTRALLNHNATVYIASRSQSKADTAIRELKESTGKTPLFLQLDLADLSSVRRAAEEFLSQASELHVLFNNAGVMVCPIEQLTADGYDMQFGTNVIGHWYFTKLLTPALLRGKDSSPDKHSRVIYTSSAAAYMGSLNWDTFSDTPARKKVSKNDLYCQSKFGNVLLAAEMARRYGEQGIISISVNPGNIKSELQRHLSGMQHKIVDTILYPTPYGALTQLYAGTMPEAIKYNGEFMIPWARLGKCREEAYDPELAKKLWNWLEEQVKG